MSNSLRFARWIRVCLTMGLYTLLSPFGYLMFAVLYVVWRRDPVARARRIIQTFQEADTGLVVIDGKLIEKPVLREMHRILAIAQRIEA